MEGKTTPLGRNAKKQHRQKKKKDPTVYKNKKKIWENINVRVNGINTSTVIWGSFEFQFFRVRPHYAPTLPTLGSKASLFERNSWENMFCSSFEYSNEPIMRCDKNIITLYKVYVAFAFGLLRDFRNTAFSTRFMIRIFFFKITEIVLNENIIEILYRF